MIMFRLFRPTKKIKQYESHVIEFFKSYEAWKKNGGIQDPNQRVAARNSSGGSILHSV